MKIRFAMLFLALAITGAQAANIMTAREGVEKSANGRVIYGTFAMTVRATGADHNIFFLDSEADYHAPDNLSPALNPSALAGLKKLYGEDLKTFFTGKTIWVTGEVKRVPIVFLKNGTSTNYGYFQHRIEVTRASQISLTPPQ